MLKIFFLSKLIKYIQYICRIIFQFIFPKKCIICRGILEDNANLCEICWPKINFISNFYCKICGNKIVGAENDNYSCGNCIRKAPRFAMARFIMIFDKNSKNIIHNFKYGDQTALAKDFAQFFINRYIEDYKDVDLIAAVPMHKFKRIYRKYNPAEILAKHIAHKLDKTFVPDLLIKTKLTKPQTSLTQKERLINIQNSLQVNIKYSISQKVVLLVDDVYTTGVTANTCSKILLQASKAKKVKFFAVAKTEKLFN